MRGRVERGGRGGLEVRGLLCGDPRAAGERKPAFFGDSTSRWGASAAGEEKSPAVEVGMGVGYVVRTAAVVARRFGGGEEVERGSNAGKRLAERLRVRGRGSSFVLEGDESRKGFSMAE
jgi:hypothetical protein